MALNFNPPSAVGAAANFSDVLVALKNAQFNPQSLISTGTTETLTGYQLAAGILVRSGVATAVTATTDTAANIIAALGVNATTNQTFVLFYANANTGTGVVTLAAGTGVTLSGVSNIPIAAMRVFVGTVTSATTVSINGVFAVGSGVTL